MRKGRRGLETRSRGQEPRPGARAPLFSFVLICVLKRKKKCSSRTLNLAPALGSAGPEYQDRSTTLPLYIPPNSRWAGDLRDGMVGVCTEPMSDVDAIHAIHAIHAIQNARI